MNRIRIKYGGAVVPVMRLTSRVLARGGGPVEVLGETDGGGAPQADPLRLDWEETVSLTRQLRESWENLSGEEILEQLEYISTTQDTGVPKSKLRQNLDLWLLKALAQEKCMLADPAEVEATYNHCGHLGKWNSVIIKNNHAVIKARRLECLDSLKLLAEAVHIAVTERVPLKAPFYNAALIFRHLHKNALLLDPRYKAILSEMAGVVGGNVSAPNGGASGENGGQAGQSDGRAGQTDDLAAPPASDEAGEIDVRAAYRSLARYGFELKEPELSESDPRAFFQKSVAYLVPSIDLSESFGDFPDQVDDRNAHKLIEQGSDFADRLMFEESVSSFNLAVKLDRTRESEVSARLALIYDEWRYERNRRMSELRDEGNLDEASIVIQELPDEHLKRPGDAELVSTLRQQKHRKLLRDAEAADEEEARLIYIGLLKEPDLDDPSRLEASSRLAERLRGIDKDAERHRALSELTLHGLHPQVVSRLAEEFERRLVREAVTRARLNKYDEAIRKYFWALLLPGRAHRREGLLKAALFQLGRFLEGGKEFDSCATIGDEVFAALRAELRERWDSDRSAALLAEFERLDAAPHLSQKRVAELNELLAQLIKYEPTTERRLARLRLAREKKAQDSFQKIESLLAQISEKEDHAETRADIDTEVNRLRGLAIYFAESKQHGYAKEINDFVLHTEELLRHADNQKFKHDRTFEVNRRKEQEFLNFRNSLGGDGTRPDETLTAICRQLRTTRGGRFFEPVAELSLHWLREEGRAAYQELAVTEPPSAALALISDSLEIIRRNAPFLPEEFKDDLRRFLEGLKSEIKKLEEELQPQGPEPKPQPEQPPPPPREGVLRRIGGWFRAQFR